MFIALIPAAGSGSRMGSDSSKLLLNIKGQSVLARTLTTFLKNPDCKKIILLVSESDKDQITAEVKRIDNNSIIECLVGGDSRQSSVYNGLKRIKEVYPDSSPLVCIHDAARCLLSEGLLSRAVKEARVSNAVTVAIPVNDTIARSESRCYEKLEHPRSSLVSIQTPQIFDFDLVFQAHNNYLKA